MAYLYTLTIALLTLLTITFGYAFLPAVKLNRPNIVVIYTDDQDLASMPNMPYLLSLPEGSWVNFTNGFVSDALCAPSRAAMLTGQYSLNHGLTLNGDGRLLDDSNTIATWLDDAGYNTALFGKYTNGYPWDNGPNWIPDGWDSFDGEMGNSVKITETAVDFIENTEGPYFLNVNYRAPHYHVDPSPKYEDADIFMPPRPPNMPEDDTSDKPQWVQDLVMTEGMLQKIERKRTKAYRTLLDVDDGVEAVVEALKERGELDNTVLIFTSDHGFSFGSHNHEWKHCPYEECHRVPLLVRYPGQAGNRTDGHYINNVDVVATIVDMAGASAGRPLDGRSFVPLLENRATYWDDAVLLEKFFDRRLDHAYFGIAVPGWKYVELDTGERELYDLTADPYELENRAGQPAYQVMQAQLATRLQGLKAGQRPPPPPTATLSPTPSLTMTPALTPEVTGTVPPTVTISATPDLKWKVALPIVTSNVAGRSPP